jgi:ethanolamine ammonia-lyase small subunit
MPSLPDPWSALRGHTAARIALGRAGASLPTAEWLRFAQAHALARDAVHTPLDATALAADLQAHGFETLQVESAAGDRATYLRRPDLGRALSPRSAALLAAIDPPGADLVVLVGDGLSARAAQAHALPLLTELRPRLEAAAWTLGPVVLALQARVALGDGVGAALRARAVLVLIGERPGLSSPDSLGAYLTWSPAPGRSDAQRNCVSNIRPEGLSCAAAAHTIAWLLVAARRLGATGVMLKDESPPQALLQAAEAPLHLPGASPATPASPATSAPPTLPVAPAGG